MKSEIIITEHELPGSVIAAIEQGQKIEAIKLLQDSTGLGLANAKVLVDRAWRTHGPERVIRSFADQPTGLSIFAKSAAVLLLLVAGWYFYQG